MIESKKLSKLIRKSNKSQEYTELDKIFNDEIKKLNDASTICSFDMEFSNVSGSEIVEVGIAIFSKDTNKTFSEHFIIEEQKGKYKRNNTPMEHSLMFAYGKSKTVSLDVAMKALSNALENSDVNIVYAEDHKHKHMLEHSFKNSSFLSVQELMKINSRDSRKIPLTRAVEEFCSSQQAINNAGNDAVSTLEILSKVVGDKINFKDYNPEVLNDYSNHQKRLSAAQIRAKRNNNPQPIINDKYTKEEVAKTKILKL